MFINNVTVRGHGADSMARRRSPGDGRHPGRRARGALRALALAASLAWVTPLAAADDENTRIDGLNQEMRQLLYNSTTSLVARLDLKRLGHDALLQMFTGAFDPDALAILRRSQPDFDKTVDSWIAIPSNVAAGLIDVKYEALTVVVSQYFGSVVGFGVLALGFNMDDIAWIPAKAALETVFELTGFDLALDRRSDYVLLKAAGDSLTGVDYSGAVKDTVLLGLSQPTGMPAFAFVSPVNNDLRAILGSVTDYGNIGPGLGQADYIGGYIVTGGRPEIHIYARFASETTASNIKAAYDAGTTAQIAKADQTDKDEAEGKAMFIMESTITGGEFERRMQRAMAMTAFGNVLRLDLDTVDLRTITGAFIDRYIRKGVELKAAGASGGSAGSGSGGGAQAKPSDGGGAPPSGESTPPSGAGASTAN
jgi:hypothetical protein